MNRKKVQVLIDQESLKDLKVYYILSTFQIENGKKIKEITVMRSFNEFFEFHKLIKK